MIMMRERVAVQFGITHHPAIRTLGCAEPWAFEPEIREFVAVR